MLVQDDRLARLALEDRPEIGPPSPRLVEDRRHAAALELGGEETRAAQLVGVRLAGVDLEIALQAPHFGQGRVVLAHPRLRDPDTGQALELPSAGPGRGGGDGESAVERGARATAQRPLER